ncbi:3'-5' exonuclease [Thermohalobacter berrensis]|uniref:3'-5' exonuclease n=1 Tax=Thermohalobacter berrensis TaxID=99594 RepID=UPI000E728C47|nr:3'-5' exonuclease [Thermohalobacter berrensis]
MKHKIFGFKKDIKINSVVIDEAQDFNIFEFYALKEILNTNMFTLLGDLSQGIHSYRSINDWNDVIDIFGKNSTSYMTLVQSYRTTVEIMDFANKVLKKLNDEKLVYAKPVIRHGEKPEIKEFKDQNKLIKSLEDKISAMLNENYKSIAVICKTMEECEKLEKFLKKSGKLDVKVIDENEEVFDGKVVLVPSHLAKGLEFDVIFITNLEEDYKNNNIDIKLLYVAMTRAHHRLYVYHTEGKLEILKS